MNHFGLINYVNIVIFLLSLIPTSKLLQYYYKTRLQEFLLFGNLFGTVAIHYIPDIIYIVYPQIWDFRSTQFFYNATIGFWYVLLFLHAVRYRWDISYPVVIVSLYYGFVVYLLYLRSFVSSDYLRFASLSLSILMIASGTLAFYVYYTTELVFDNRFTRNARLIWLFVGILLMFNATIVLIRDITENQILNQITSYNVFFANLAILMLVAFISLRYPHFILLSHAQVARAGSLYQKVKSQKQEEPLGMKTLENYLNSIPSHLLSYSEIE